MLPHFASSSLRARSVASVGRLVRAAVAVPSVPAARATATALLSAPTRHSQTSSRSFAAAAAAASRGGKKDVSVESPVLVERRANGVVVLRFNRPSSLNAMNLAMGDEFLKTVNELIADPELRCVILTGSGKAFSAGGDLDFLLECCAATPLASATAMRGFYARFLCLLQLPVPVIAAINGPAVGAGMCVATACDYRVAARDTDLGYTFTRIGFHPGQRYDLRMGCTHFLPALVGQQHASRLLLTGDIIKGTRGHEIGLIGELVDQADDVLPAALRLADDIATNSPVAIRTLTTSLRLVHQDNLERALYREADAQSQTYATAELRENITAIKNKTGNRNKKQAK